MSSTCVNPSGECFGCDHCAQDETICTATEEYKKTCDQKCGNCDYCDEGEAYCDLENGGLIPPCRDCASSLTLETGLECSECVSHYMADMRRFLFRNVACEARKLSDIARHMPDLPGWA